MESKEKRLRPGRHSLIVAIPLVSTAAFLSPPTNRNLELKLKLERNLPWFSGLASRRISGDWFGPTRVPWVKSWLPYQPCSVSSLWRRVLYAGRTAVGAPSRGCLR